MKGHFDDLQIDQQYISAFASGSSINNLSAWDIELIKKKSFLITMNYAPINIIGHMNIWSDIHVMQWLNKLYRRREKDNLFMAREKSKRKDKLPIYEMVDYWFDEKKEGLKGNYTIVWLLQLLQNHFPTKKVLIFGLDMIGLSNDRAKWYDDHIDFDKIHRGKTFKIDRKLNQCARQLTTIIGANPNFINCNLQSQYDGFVKRNWKDILNENVNTNRRVDNTINLSHCKIHPA